MPVIKNARQRPYVNSGTANAGTPASGTAGFSAGVAEPGALAVGGTKLFINTNTKASPTWTVVGGQS